MERVSLAEAARRLDLTVDATRKRIKRGLLVADKDVDGRWFITLPDANEATEVDNSAMRVSTRTEQDLREEVEFLRERLREAERERGELRRMLNLEQQNVARLLPATIPDAPAAREQATDSQSPVSTPPVAPGGAEREPEPSWRARLRRWMGWE
ncbi:MAG: hypothetical protein M3008_09560 [Chloroflexota bacterium]|nr:hypothetical protein [Chloroflexota bacterium]